MTVRVRVADASELSEGEPLRVEAFGREIALVRHRGRIYALDDVCPHRGGPMHQGEVEDGCLTCPLHGWAFSLDTGEMPDNPALKLETFAAVEEDGAILLVGPE